MSKLSHTFLDRLCFHFYDDYDDLKENFRPSEINRIMRLRELDREIMRNPGRPDKDRAQWLKLKYSVSERQAYIDIQDLRIVVGIPESYNKDYDRMEMMQLLRERIHAAIEREDDNAVAKLMKEYNVMARFGKDEPPRIDPHMAPLSAVPTSDVSVLGLPPIENEEALKLRIRQKYDREYAKDVEYEEIKPMQMDLFEDTPMRAERFSIDVEESEV